jgi:formate/nitrite transporter FocA (FNT family)
VGSLLDLAPPGLAISETNVGLVRAHGWYRLYWKKIRPGWLCMGARSVTDKILATVFPITAFVACGFEHSVANMYSLPIGVALAAGTSAPLSVIDAVSNLALVTLGNVLGGTVLVALVYWSVYLRYSD